MDKPKKRRQIPVRYESSYRKLEDQMDKHLSRLNGPSVNDLLKSLSAAKQ